MVPVLNDLSNICNRAAVSCMNMMRVTEIWGDQSGLSLRCVTVFRSAKRSKEIDGAL